MQVRNEIYKKEKFHDMRLTIVCVKFNDWKLMTSLFLFFMRKCNVVLIIFLDMDIDIDTDFITTPLYGAILP